ncbi:MAG: D-alanyl-D-alanine carboxypeptidase/D-alanyl-D-alanine-endopeptidase [Pseudomonadota bacterium]
MSDTMRIARRLCATMLFAGAVIAPGTPAEAEAPFALAPETVARQPAPRPAEIPPPPPATHDLARRARVSGQIGWMVADIDTGEVIDAAGAHHPFAPASVAKLPTAAFALEQLGGGHRFETRLVARGEIAAGVLRGDLVLEGGGDPELDTDALAPLASAIAGAGITRVEGFLRPEIGGWAETPAIMAEQPEDAPYNPAVSRLSLNFNRVRLEWPRRAKAKDVKVMAHATHLRPLTDAVRVATGSSLPAPLVHSFAEDHERWDIVAAALRRKGARWLPVRRPAAYTARVFAGLATTKGVEITGGALSPATSAHPAGAAEGETAVASLVTIGDGNAAELPSGKLIARHESRPLADILREMLRYSTNITAELCGMAASGPVAAEGLERSADALNAWAAARAGFPQGDAGFRLANHSGLSLASRVSPARMVQLLQAVALKPAPAETVDERLPGGVAQLLRPHNIAARNVPFDYAGTAVAAKTGTMHFVRGLSGYVTTPKGRRLAFAVFANDLPRRAQGEYGARSWANRARNLERTLIREWVLMADATPAKTSK